MLLDLAHRLRRLVLGVTGWRTRGVRVMVFDPTGRLLLVRHGYADRTAWTLPGGGLRWRETPAAGAAREVREETGCAVDGIEPLGTFASTAEGWRDTVHLFRATTVDGPTADGWEVKEACFFPLEALPAETSAATLRRVGELNGTARSPTW